MEIALRVLKTEQSKSELGPPCIDLIRAWTIRVNVRCRRFFLYFICLFFNLWENEGRKKLKKLRKHGEVYVPLFVLFNLLSLFVLVVVCTPIIRIMITVKMMLPKPKADNVGNYRAVFRALSSRWLVAGGRRSPWLLAVNRPIDRYTTS